MVDEFQLNFNIKIVGKTKDQIKTWAEGLTVWELYQLSKTHPYITFSMTKPQEFTDIVHVPDDLE